MDLLQTRTQRFLLIALLIVGLAGGITGCGPADSGTDLEVTDARLVQSSNGQRSFAATLVNNEAGTIPFAAVKVAFYGESGMRVETTRIGVQDIPADGRVDFSGPIDSDQAFSQAQVQSILTP